MLDKWTPGTGPGEYSWWQGNLKFRLVADTLASRNHLVPQHADLLDLQLDLVADFHQPVVFVP
ncbi:MAG: hypothetical protein ACI9MU_002052 [Alphaproteobacteria bacterium]|jgi:hypothetical protein